MRLGWAKEFNHSLVKAGTYLADKETIECLEVHELENILQQLEMYSVVRVNDIPYSLGRSTLTVDELVADKLCDLLSVSDKSEDDLYVGVCVCVCVCVCVYFGVSVCADACCGLCV